MTEPLKGLTLYEANALKEARNLLVRKPEAVMRYLSGQVGEDNKGLIALALSAQLNHSKMQLESMTLCKVVAEHVNKLNKESTVDVQNLIDTLDRYLQECIADDEDRWITREALHAEMKKLKESKHETTND